jgi:glutamine amidotransferase
MTIVIIDYGLSNLNSVYNTFKTISPNIIISSDKDALYSATILVLPGVGTFKDGMKSLDDKGLSNVIKKCVLDKRIPIIGICLGMQMLATTGYEGGKTEGLNLIEGEVKKIIPQRDERTPHIGWNEIKHNDCSMFRGIPNNSDFYFIHSYVFDVSNVDHVRATTGYCNDFASVVCKDDVHGIQFHPEKSQKAGLILLQNICSKYI